MAKKISKKIERLMFFLLREGKKKGKESDFHSFSALEKPLKILFPKEAERALPRLHTLKAEPRTAEK